jgi:hypothetical protein
MANVRAKKLAEAKKNVEDLYKAIFALREALQDATQLASEAATIAESFGGEISRVMTEQLNKFFIPGISKFIDDTNTPGAAGPLVTFLDSVPLALTREEPMPGNSTPAPVAPEQADLAAPAQGSFASQTQQESKKKALSESSDFDSLMQYKPVGNFYSDSRFFDKAEAFIVDERNSTEDRLAILKQFDNGVYQE